MGMGTCVHNHRSLHVYNYVCVQMADYIDKHCLTESVEWIKEIGDNISTLKAVGAGHGVWHFDQELLKK